VSGLNAISETAPFDRTGGLAGSVVDDAEKTGAAIVFGGD